MSKMQVMIVDTGPRASSSLTQVMSEKGYEPYHAEHASMFAPPPTTIMH